MPVNAVLAHRLSHPTPQDRLDLREDRRLSFIQLHIEGEYNADGSPALREGLVAWLSWRQRAADAIARGVPYTEDDARRILADVEPPLSLVLEACHYGGTPARTVAGLLGLHYTTVYDRLSAARGRMERWTGRPLARPKSAAAP